MNPLEIQHQIRELDLMMGSHRGPSDHVPLGPVSGSAELKIALSLSSRRKWLCEKARPCPWCKSTQVQLECWDGFPAMWQCRECSTHFTYEPGPKDEPILPPTPTNEPNDQAHAPATKNL